MKRDIDRIDLVADVFAKRELDLARQLGQFQATLAQAEEQLQMLYEHRDQEALKMRAGVMTDPSRLQNQQAFLGRINGAIGQQKLVIDRARNDREELRRRWLASRRKTQSALKLGEKCRDSMRRDEELAEQKQQDELARRIR